MANVHRSTFDARNPSAAGATLHGDHAVVFYQVPMDARPLPLVFWHGAGQSKKTWETTVDGREGFQNIFLRRRFAVYLLDQPRRGAAGRSTVASTIPATTDDQMWFGMFRIGLWPDYFPGVQFSRDPDALDQYFRSMTAVPVEQFMALTRVPIVLYFGDNIPEEPSPNPGQDNWRVRLAMARIWRDTVNRHGGNVTLVRLPELGIRGNTHFAFSDTNNIEIANLLSKFLAEKQLDGGARR